MKDNLVIGKQQRRLERMGYVEIGHYLNIKTDWESRLYISGKWPHRTLTYIGTCLTPTREITISKPIFEKKGL